MTGCHAGKGGTLRKGFIYLIKSVLGNNHTKPQRKYSQCLLWQTFIASIIGLSAIQASLAAQYNGVIKGEFNVNDVGAATYTIPIQVPPGIGGMQPQLSLNYSSQSGNGLLGMGWPLGGLSVIHRCPQTLAQDNNIHGVDSSTEDRFYIDGQRLIAFNGV